MIVWLIQIRPRRNPVPGPVLNPDGGWFPYLYAADLDEAFNLEHAISHRHPECETKREKVIILDGKVGVRMALNRAILEGAMDIPVGIKLMRRFPGGLASARKNAELVE